MKKFEYDITKFYTNKEFDNDGDPFTTNLKDEVLINIMDKMGRQGWELVSVTTLLEAIYTDKDDPDEYEEYSASIVKEIILFWKKEIKTSRI